MLQKIAFTCKLFDPLFLKGKERVIEGLRTLSKDLVCFDYSHLDYEFIE